MKILVLSMQDSGGGCGKLARAINEHPAHQAKAARWYKGRLDYNINFSVIWQPSAIKTLGLIRWCDAILVSGPWRGLPKQCADIGNTVIPKNAPKRPLIVLYRGTPYRKNKDRYNAYDRSHDVVQCGNFLDLLCYGKFKYWLPVPIWEQELMPYRKPNTDTDLVVFQCVTKNVRRHLKSVDQVQRVLSTVDNLKYNYVHDVTNSECLAEMGQSDVVITAFKNGYGNAGLEAMAMGIPVIANGFQQYIAKVKRHVGYCPFVKSSPRDLPIAINLLRNPETWQEYSDIGKKYIEDFHSPMAVAKRAISICRTARPVTY